MTDEHTPDTPGAPAEPSADAGDRAPVLEPMETEASPFAGEEPIVLPEPEPERAGAAAASTPSEEPATIPAGRRVTLVVSRGRSTAPPSVPVAMPDLTGEQQGAALLRLQSLGLAVQVLHDHHDRLPRGFVTGQYPSPDAAVSCSADVVLVVSSGRSQLPTPDVMLPSVVGLNQTLAAEKITAASLVPRVVYDHDPAAASGTVIAQLPSPESLAVPLRRRGGKGWLVSAVLLLTIAIVAGAVWYFNRPTPVPNLVGLTQTQAERSVRVAGFALGSVVTSLTAREQEIGLVVGQAPLPGGTAAYGTPISLVVAGGQLLTAVPNTVGMPQSSAIKSFQDAGLGFEVTRTFSSTVPSGSIVSQAPSAGQKVPPGTTVGLAVSMGVNNVTVPSVVGQIRTTAETALRSSGLSVAVATNYQVNTVAGTVMGQQPTVGTGVPPGTVVGITVSNGAPPLGSLVTTVPVVAGKTLSKGQSALKTAHLKYLVVKRAGTGRPKNDIVAQLPDTGAVVPRNSVIIIFASSGK